MAFEISHIWVLRAQLKAESPISVGGLGGDASAQLDLARNGAGDYYIPGTSLGGVLRARCRDDLQLTREAESQLFGRGPDRDRKARSHGAASPAEDSDGWASRLTVADAPVDASGTELRDGVGIDRWSGGPAEQILYTRKVLSAGSSLPLHVTVEVPAQGTDVSAGAGEPPLKIDQAISQLASHLLASGLTIGAGGTRGLGRLRVDTLDLHRLDVTRDRAHLKAWWALRAGHAGGPIPGKQPVEAAASTGPDSQWRFIIEWMPTAPVLAHAQLLAATGEEGESRPQLPLMTRHAGRWRAVLPGSSIKGALRSRAEHIVRTVRGEAVTSGDFLEQVSVPIARDLFGRARARAPGDGAAVRQKGALTAADCHHRRDCQGPGTNWSPQSEAYPGYALRTRIAVDRWTGGALKGALFTQVEPGWQSADGASPWEPIELRVDVGDGRDEPDTTRQELMMGLLWLTLRDMAAGRIPLGFGTRRGMGSIKVTQVTCEHAGGRFSALGPDGPDERWLKMLKGWASTWEREATKWQG